MRDPDRQTRSGKLIIGLLLSFGLGVVVTVIGFIGTLAYMFTTAHLHAADRSVKYLYLIAPGLGISIAIIGCSITIPNSVKSRPGAGRFRGAHERETGSIERERNDETGKDED